MTTMMIDPMLEDLEADLKFVIHHIDVCPDCAELAIIGAIVKCRCGHVKSIEGFLPHPDLVSCEDCRASRPACGFCGRERRVEVY